MKPAPNPGPLKALADLTCIGATSAEMLMEAGIATPAQLRKLGPEEAWRRLRFTHGKRVTINFIYALEAAITGTRWKDLKPARKARLKAAAEAVRAGIGR